ncbi:TIGR03826 family flagellar region protein [Bacillus sp. SB49]|nr:TIGR03826 family flagellar region protein [Bacillus sp. SB49]
MMGEVANCPRCNGIFIKGSSVVCPNCKQKEESDFQAVYTFMRKKQNRTAVVAEIVAKTGVSEERIRQFVKQKRLHPSQFPNLDYPCEKCGTSISEGRICKGCREDITRGVAVDERNKALENRKRAAEKERVSRTYYSVEND